MWPMENGEEIEAYVQTLLPLLLLQHWEVKVLIEPIDDAHGHTVMGEMVKTPGRPQAVLVINPMIFEEGPETQRHFIVHELLHCQVDRLFRHIESVRQVFSEMKGGSNLFFLNVASDAARLDMEELTDTLTYIIEPLAPLPS